MKTKKRLLALAFATSFMAFAQHSIKFNDDMALRFGGDIRARWEAFDRAVPNPDIAHDAHPMNQYYRMRTRAWLALDIRDSLTINLRLTNRIHKVSSSPSNPNDRHSSTWEFPDEFIFDLANVVYRWHAGESDYSITLGRQTVVFGNGMIFSDATPFDQGRGSYNDGAMFKSRSKIADDTSFDWGLFSFYDTWKDRFIVIRDRNRALRQADIFTAGGFFGICKEEKKEKLAGAELLYMYNNVNDTRSHYAERNFEEDYSGSLFTTDLRVFWHPVHLVEMSLEHATQYSGKLSSLAHCGDRIHTAFMTDARLDFHLDDYLPLAPIAGLELTCFSGNREGHRQNAWKPLFSQCPLWGDELVPIQLNGNWSNIVSYRSSLKMTPFENAQLQLAATEYTANVKSTSAHTGEGRHIGLLLSGSASYKFNDHLSMLLQLSHLDAGDYYANGHDSFWSRIELLYTF